MKDAYTFACLQAQDMPEVHQVFLKSFADYFVPIQLTEAQFAAKLKRENILPAFCVAAYAGKEIVGFILTGLGEFNGKPTAYNAGTGVLPAHRGNGLTRCMYAYLFPKLQESGVEQCLLEVIQENVSALRAYKAVGFSTKRSLDSFRATKQELLLQGDEPEGIVLQAVTKPDWETYQHFWDKPPAWQNTGTAFTNSPDDKIVLEARETGTGELVGYAAFFSGNGAIAQLAVAPSSRGQGIGKALLREVSNQVTAPALMLINVDADAVALKDFLRRRHFTHFLTQYEMVKPLE